MGHNRQSKTLMQRQETPHRPRDIEGGCKLFNLPVEHRISEPAPQLRKRLEKNRLGNLMNAKYTMAMASVIASIIITFVSIFDTVLFPSTQHSYSGLSTKRFLKFTYSIKNVLHSPNILTWPIVMGLNDPQHTKITGYLCSKDMLRKRENTT